MDNTIHNVQQLGNEIVFLWCLHFMLVFTDYTTDPAKRHYIGFVYLIFMAVVIVINLVLIAYTIFKELQTKYRTKNDKKDIKVHNKKKEEEKGIQLKRRENVEERLYFDDEIPQPVVELLENRSVSRVDEEVKEESKEDNDVERVAERVPEVIEEIKEESVEESV